MSVTRIKLAAIVLLVCAALAAGCSGSSSAGERSVLLVSDSLSGDPIVGASIRVAPLYLYLPVAPFTIVNPLAKSGEVRHTDEAGAAQLSSRGPLRVSVHAAGYMPLSAIMDGGLTLTEDEFAAPGRAMNVRLRCD